MDRQPDGRFVGSSAFDAVPPMRGDGEPVAGRQCPRRRLVLETQGGGALEQDDPFGPGLVEPEARRAALPGRHDPLDAHARARQQRFEAFFRLGGVGQIGEQVAGHGMRTRKGQFSFP